MLKKISLYNGTVKLKFNEARHIFYDEKGKPLLSVTGATGVVDKSAPLMGWATKMMGLYLLEEKARGNKEITEELVERAKKEYRRIKTEAADIGTEIHEWVSQWILGKSPEIPDNESVANGITAFLKFQKEHQLKWVESERFIYSKRHKYVGILDAIAREGKKLTLVDFKSSNGIYDEMRFQVAGYQIAYEEETGKKFDKKILIRFGKNDGQFEIMDLGNDPKDKQAFLACLNLKKRLKELAKNNGNRF
jgi:hypothetical protein